MSVTTTTVDEADAASDTMEEPRTLARGSFIPAHLTRKSPQR
ncbi:hypothetical protein [Nocardia nepalensis]